MQPEMSAPKTTPLESPACVGSASPPFTLTEPISDTIVSLADFQGRDTLLVFFRGTWCPFCVEQMRLLSQNQARLDAANIALVGVVCQSAEGVARFLMQSPLPFPLLPDETRAVAKSYGVHYYFSLEGFNLAHPALFILDKSHRITFRHVGRNMQDLPVERILGKFLSFLEQTNTSPTPEDKGN